MVVAPVCVYENGKEKSLAAQVKPSRFAERGDRSGLRLKIRIAFGAC